MVNRLVGLGLVVFCAVFAAVQALPPVKDPLVCGPVCAIFCPFGNVLDARGCPTCTCKEPISKPMLPPPNPRCGPICRMFCPNGFVEDKNGCPICKCKPFKPIVEPPVLPSIVKPPVLPPVVKPPIVKPPVVKPPVCGPVCLIHCPFGNVLDARGCPTCRCKPGPVSPRRCPRGSVLMVPHLTCKAGPLGADDCGKDGFCNGGRRGPGVCCRRRSSPIGRCPSLRSSPAVMCKQFLNECMRNRDCKGGVCCPGRCGRVCVPIKPLPLPY